VPQAHAPAGQWEKLRQDRIERVHRRVVISVFAMCAAMCVRFAAHRPFDYGADGGGSCRGRHFVRATTFGVPSGLDQATFSRFRQKGFLFTAFSM